MTDIGRYNDATYVQSLVATSDGVNQASDVNLRSVLFHTEQEYVFANDITTDDITNTLSLLHGISPATITAVEKDARRRLQAFRLLQDTKAWITTIETEAAGDAAAISATATNQTQLVNNLRVVTGRTDVTAVAAGTPTNTVTVEVELLTTGTQSLDTLIPSPANMTAALTQNFGTAADVSVGGVQQTSTDNYNEVDVAVGLRHTFVFFSCLFAMFVTRM